MSVGILGTLERGIPRISLGGKGIEALSRMPTKSAKGWRSWRCPDAGRCPSVGRSTFNARRSASWAGSMAAGSTATARPSAIGPLDAPRGEAGRSMAPRARSWAGSMRSARLGRSSRWRARWPPAPPPPPGPRRSGRSMHPGARPGARWRRGRGAGRARCALARWPDDDQEPEAGEDEDDQEPEAGEVTEAGQEGEGRARQYQ